MQNMEILKVTTQSSISYFIFRLVNFLDWHIIKKTLEALNISFYPFYTV